jgi:hypothetical protein
MIWGSVPSSRRQNARLTTAVMPQAAVSSEREKTRP